MSKMSWLHAELSEKASELGFESIEEAEQNGYEISMDGMTPILKPNVDKQLELAHKDWLGKRKEVLEQLAKLHDNYVEGDYKTKSEQQIIKNAIEFIKQGEI